ncbi:MipA/OmpV family protein [Falsiroseomonas sp. E2-1-a20]|uniref:MipA/OmpV family protein n=1 Tax=Falsiroseomonas sp. E2-1-a20 TaxID=3239300 RepID=UPI003F364CD8
MSLKHLLIVTCLVATLPVSAQEVRRPLLEAGAFAGVGLLPDYPASDRAEPRALALPWLIYRGEILQSDERGLRGRLLRSADFELTFNANGALGSRSSGGARAGMDDLDPMGEVGPSLRWVAWRDTARLTRLVLEAPVRAAFTTDFSRIRHRGFVFAPEISLERTGLFQGLFQGLLRTEGGADRARIGLGPVFATGGVMDDWYRVRPSEARPGRPAYEAEGGFLGMRLQFSYRVPVTDRISLTTGGRVENFAGAANAESPLSRSEWNATLVGGISVSLYRSTATVASGAEPYD